MSKYNNYLQHFADDEEDKKEDKNEDKKEDKKEDKPAWAKALEEKVAELSKIFSSDNSSEPIQKLKAPPITQPPSKEEQKQEQQTQQQESQSEKPEKKKSFLDWLL